MKFNSQKKVLIAMSGGVDSSVAATLLKKQGFQVEGLFVFFEEKEKTNNNPRSCCSIESLHAAKKVASILAFPLKTLNLSVDFKKEIIDDFINEYNSGNTPNPCVRCNKYFKFGKLLDYVKQNGFDYLATGHYAKTLKYLNTKTQPVRRSFSEGGKHTYKLITPKDKTKDQTYFLYNLNSEKLNHILFPLADFKKTKIKKIAKKLNLPTHNKKESSDVCFVNANLREFLKSRINTNKGNIINILNNKKIGEHIGLPFYTIGQRHGINIGGTGPYYVIKKDFEKNNLIVTNDKNDSQLFTDKIFVKNINWISSKPDFLNLSRSNRSEAKMGGENPSISKLTPFKCLAQHRYQTQMQEVNIYIPLLTKEGLGEVNKEKYLIKYKKPQRAITSGQSIVFYKPTRKFLNQSFEVLGGGVIDTK